MTRIKSLLGFRRRAVVVRITMGCESSRGVTVFLKINRKAGLQLIVALLLCAFTFGQAPPGSRAAQRLEGYRQSKATALRDDFGELARYRAANASLSLPLRIRSRSGSFGIPLPVCGILQGIFPASRT